MCSGVFFELTDTHEVMFCGTDYFPTIRRYSDFNEMTWYYTNFDVDDEEHADGRRNYIRDSI